MLLARCLVYCLLVPGLMSVGCAQEGLEITVSNDVKNSEETMPGITQGLTGLVETGDGRPVTGAMIVPVPLGDDTPAIPEIAILTDAAGRYNWPLPPGTYEVSVSAEGYRTAKRRVEVGADKLVTLNVMLSSIHKE